MLSAQLFWRLLVSQLVLGLTAAALLVLAVVEGRAVGSPWAALLALFAVVIGLATLSISYAFAAVRRQSVPLRQLAEAVDRLADGDICAGVYLDNRDEIGR